MKQLKFLVMTFSCQFLATYQHEITLHCGYSRQINHYYTELHYHEVRIRSDSTAPHPTCGLSNDPKFDPFLSVKGTLLVGSTNHHILPSIEPAQATWIIAKDTIFANLQ